MNTIDVDTLRYFITIADCGSLRMAAEVFQITPSALTQHIQKLEKSLGRKCFIKSSNHQFTLTSFGIRYYRYCEDALKLWDSFLDELSALKSTQPDETANCENAD